MHDGSKICMDPITDCFTHEQEKLCSTAHFAESVHNAFICVPYSIHNFLDRIVAVARIHYRLPLILTSESESLPKCIVRILLFEYSVDSVNSSNSANILVASRFCYYKTTGHDVQRLTIKSIAE